MTTYTITLTDRQAATLSEACELLARLGVGQITTPSTPLYATQPDLQARVEELERGIDMLAMLFDKYENGPSCYEEPDERTGYLGNAVRLDDPDFHRIADFLNKHRPVGAAQESGN